MTTDWFGGAMAGWSAADRAELTRLMEKLTDDVCAHLRAQRVIK
ncbi:hypothetical protein [Nonomuraea sp. SYSU D8015]|nr:hypothetical protein [Nonomuraea sp. SYSU D8015]